MTTPTVGAPTQVRFSARSVVRTILQVIVPAVLALGVVVPEVVEVILEQAGEQMPQGLRGVLLAVSAGVAAVAGALAKIMALPKVEAFLRSSRFLKWLAAEPAPVPPVDVDPAGSSSGPHLSFRAGGYVGDTKKDAALYDGKGVPYRRAGE